MSEWWKNFAAAFCLVAGFIGGLVALGVAMHHLTRAFGLLPAMAVIIVGIAAVCGVSFANDQAGKRT